MEMCSASRRYLGIALVVASGFALVGCAGIGVGSEPPNAGWSVHRIDDGEISESSGLVASRTHTDVFWTHNDSGDAARLFAITPEGRKLAEFSVDGATHVDWEDIAIDETGYLYLGDIGNNANERRDLAIYRIREPDPARRAGSVPVDRVIRYRYRDQTAFPEDGNSVFDAESMLWHDGWLYLYTKHRSDTKTRLYRVSDAASGDEEPLVALGEIELGGGTARLIGNVTGADISADGGWIALLTYRGILIFDRRGPLPLPAGPVARIALAFRKTGQVESIAWLGEALVFGNEAGKLFRIDEPLAASWFRFPPH